MLVSLAIFGLLLHSPKGQDASAVYKKVLPSTMTLLAAKSDGSKSIGTAFLVLKEGMALTAWHVVQNATGVVAKFSNGEEFEVTGLVDRDEKRDLALIRVKVADKPMLSFVSGDPDVGSKAFVIGAPKGLEFSISDGLLSGIREIEGIKQYQFSCPASPGNSGGPMVDDKGSVMGVVSWQLREGQNLNFAVPASYAKALDTSLPTQQWTSIKQTQIPSFKDKNDDAKSASKVLEIRAQVNFHVFAAYDFSREASRVSASRLQIPSSVFSAIDSLPRLAKQMRSLEFSDAELSEAAAAASEDYERMARGFDDLKLSALSAMRSGWDNYANTLSNKGYASIAGSPVRPWSKVNSKLDKLVSSEEKAKYSSDLLDGMLKEKRYMYTEKVGLVLDIRAIPKCVIAVCGKASIAEHSDFRPSDEIVEIAGEAPVGLTSFERILMANRGKSVSVKVKRYRGGDSNLKLEVPK